MIPHTTTSRTLRFSVSLLLAASVICVSSAIHLDCARAADDPAVARALYSQGVAEHYNYRFGVDHPFLPSNATTDTGEFIRPKNFPTAKYCGHCHQEAHAQWRQSAHANSFRTPWYTERQPADKGKGIEYSRHCEGCHDPTALVSGAMTKGSPIDRNFDQDGITCIGLPLDSESRYARNRQLRARRTCCARR